MRSFFILVLITSLSLKVSSQISIAAARATPVGSTVTIKGIITNAAEQGINFRFMQDGTAGMAVYNGTASAPGFTAVTTGDSVSITGPTVLYFNLLEINPIQGFTVHASGKPVPAAVVITPSALAEPVEGQLVTIQNCTFAASGNFAPVSANYTVASGSQTFVVRIVSTNTSIVGQPVPTGAVNITGLASQYCSSPANGCTTGYQLLPRSMSDFVAFAGINDLTKNESLSVYPNPASNSLHFKIAQNEEVRRVIIKDQLGREVFSAKENTTSVDISYLANGIYTIEVGTNKTKYFSKFTVAR
jgi:hypothetical protein